MWRRLPCMALGALGRRHLGAGAAGGDGEAAASLVFGKLEGRMRRLEGRYESLLAEAHSDATPQSKLGEIHKEVGRLHAPVERIGRLKALREELTGVGELLRSAEQDRDEGMAELAREEAGALREEEERLAFEVLRDLLPKADGTEGVKGLLLEIRAGAGGEEAALFCVDLLQMYQKLAQRKRWRFEILSLDEAEFGGYKEVVAEVTGEGCYQQLQFESGIHRVQVRPGPRHGRHSLTHSLTQSLSQPSTFPPPRTNDTDNATPV